MDLLEQAANNPEKLNLEGLGYNELTEVKRNIETEINVLSNSFEQLRMAATKFSAAKEKLMVFTPEANDNLSFLLFTILSLTSDSLFLTIDPFSLRLCP